MSSLFPTIKTNIEKKVKNKTIKKRIKILPSEDIPITSTLLENPENNEKEEENKDEEKDVSMELQLGDVVQITSPKDERLNDQIFLIDYIDSSKIHLVFVVFLFCLVVIYQCDKCILCGLFFDTYAYN